jgi:hypothetical protein
VERHLHGGAESSAQRSNAQAAARVWVGLQKEGGCGGGPGARLKGEAGHRHAGLKEGRGEILGRDCGEALLALGKEGLTCGAAASARGERGDSGGWDRGVRQRRRATGRWGRQRASRRCVGLISRLGGEESVLASADGGQKGRKGAHVTRPG